MTFSKHLLSLIASTLRSEVSGTYLFYMRLYLKSDWTRQGFSGPLNWVMCVFLDVRKRDKIFDVLINKTFNYSQSKRPFNYYVSKGVGEVRKWQSLLIYSTIYADVSGWVGLKKPKTWWRYTWMVPAAEMDINVLFSSAQCIYTMIFQYFRL